MRQYLIIMLLLLKIPLSRAGDWKKIQYCLDYWCSVAIVPVLSLNCDKMILIVS